MGLKKELKKTVKAVGNALTDPKNAVNMLNSTYALGKNLEKQAQTARAEKKANEIAEEQAQTDAAEQEFQEKLDRKRRLSKRTNVIFAGILGNSDEIGLGGQKNLLGL